MFRRFKNLDLAEDLANLLKSNDIVAYLTDDVPPVDVTFTGDTLPYNYEIQLYPRDFPKANQVLKKHYQALVNDAENDHYLFEFSDNELLEIIQKPDEWSEYDFHLAVKILKERGKELDDLEIQEYYHERISELEIPEHINRGWIVTGYILCLLGGFVGVIIGYVIWQSKKTLPNGERIPTYFEDDRKNGKIMFFIGLVLFLITATTRLALEISMYSK